MNFMDPVKFIHFYFVIINDKMQKILDDYSKENYHNDYLNFLLNFSCNFRDASFVKIVKDNCDVYNKLIEILKKIERFLEDNLSTEDNFSLRIKRNLNLYTHILVRIYDLYRNIKESEISDVTEKFQNFENYFENFKKFTKYDLYNFSNLIYEKPGWACLDFKGNFIYADSTMQDLIFECKDLNGKNLFDDYLTDFSKFNIRKNWNNFFDYKIEEKRNVNVKFTIDVRASKSELSTSNYNYDVESKLLNHLNSVKTLKCNFSAMILQGSSENKTECAILMKAYLARNRENFDDLILMNFNF